MIIPSPSTFFGHGAKEQIGWTWTDGLADLMIFIHLGTVITVNGANFVAYGSRKRMLTESELECTRSIVMNVNTQRAIIAKPSTQESEQCVWIIRASEVISFVVAGIAERQLARNQRMLTSKDNCWLKRCDGRRCSVNFAHGKQYYGIDRVDFVTQACG